MSRKIGLRRNSNLLIFAVGCLHLPEDASDVVHNEGPVHAGYICFSTPICLREVSNEIGIKNIEYACTIDMSEHIAGFESYCLTKKLMYYIIPARNEVPKQATAIVDAYRVEVSAVEEVRAIETSVNGTSLALRCEPIKPAQQEKVMVDVNQVEVSAVEEARPREGSRIRTNRLFACYVCQHVPQDKPPCNMAESSSLEDPKTDSPSNRDLVDCNQTGEKEVIDLTDYLSFDEEDRMLINVVTALKIKNGEGHLYKFYRLMTMLVSKCRITARHTNGVFHIIFEDTDRFLTDRRLVPKQCFGCVRKLKGGVVTHRCECGQWNAYHWICFKRRFACQLNSNQNRKSNDYLIKCGSCDGPLFRNHPYLCLM